METLRWAVAAPGKIAHVFSAALKDAHDRGELTLAAVASRDKGRASDFAQKWGFARFYGSYTELFADPDVDVVYIASPQATHTRLSIEALEAGKHVVCEKPASLSAGHLRSVIDTARRCNRFYLEALWMRFNPAVLAAFSIMRKGGLGTIQSISAHFHLFRPFDAQNRRFMIDTGGGALLELGIYPLSFAMASASGGSRLLKPRSLQAVSRFFANGVDSETNIQCLFSAADNSVISARLSTSFTDEHEDFKSAWIIGSEAKIRLPQFWQAQKFEIWDTSCNLIETRGFPFAVNGYEYEIAEVNRCISQGLLESPLHSHADCLSLFETLDAIRGQIGLHYPEETQPHKKTAVPPLDHPGELSIYTDGGCSGNPGPGGWGCVIIDGDITAPAEKPLEYIFSGGECNTTNNRMELMAVIAALGKVGENPAWKGRRVTVYTDSTYVKNGITSWISSWKRNGWKTASKDPVKNQDLWMSLDTLASPLSVRWVWVKGHAGIKYNELVDTLTRKEIDAITKNSIRS